MAYRTNTLTRTCDKCGRSGTMTYEEEDQTGETTRWIDASGCYVIGADDKPYCKCEVRGA